MGIPILGSVLRALANVYKFEAGASRAPSDFETSLPIQPVHDVRQMATLGAAIGPLDGFWVGATVLTHTIVGTLTFDASLRYPATSWNGYPPAPAYDPRVQMAWLHRVWGNTDDATDFSLANISVLYPITAIGPVGTTAPSIQEMLYFRSTLAVGNKMIPAVDGSYTNPVPILVGPAGTTITDAFIRNVTVSDTLGTVVNTIYTLIWIGPKGIFPPGM